MNFAGTVLLIAFAFIDMVVLINLRQRRRLALNENRMERVLADAVRRDLAVAEIRPRRTLLNRAR
jgi:hypothetical protein